MEIEPLNLGEILAIYKRWYRLSLLTFFGILIPAVIVIFLILPMYQATGSIWVNRLMPQSPYTVREGAISSETTFRNLDRKEEISTYVEMVKARPIAEAVVSRLSLTMEKLNRIRDARRYVQAVIDGVIDGARYVYDTIKYTLGLAQPMPPDVEAALRHVKLVDEVIERIEAQPATESNIIEISFRSSDPVLAKEAVNIVLDEFLRFSNAIREERAKKFFTASADSLRQSLHDAEAALLDLQSRHTSYSVGKQREMLVEKYTEAKNRLRSLEVYQAKLKAQIESYGKRLKNEPQLYQELKLRRVTSEVELDASMQEIESTKAMLEKYADDLRKLGEAELNVKAQQRKIQQLEEAYKTNLRNLEGASAIEAMNLASLSAVRVVSYAPYPIKPIRPRKLYYLLFAFAGALLAALAVPFLAYLNDKTIAEPRDVKKYLGLDFVTVFPDLAGKMKTKG